MKMMAWTRLTGFIFLLLPVNMAQLTGVIKQPTIQKPFVIQDLHICIKNSIKLSILYTLKDVFRCIEKQLSQCLSTFFLRISSLSYNYIFQENIYCGAFSINDRHNVLADTRLDISIIKGHIIYAQVHTFIFHISKTILCSQHGIEFKYKQYNSEHYCGTRVPWTLVIPHDRAYLYLNIMGHTYFELSLFYSSFNVNWVDPIIHINTIYINFKMRLCHIKNKNSLLYYYILTHHRKKINLHLLKEAWKL